MSLLCLLYIPLHGALKVQLKYEIIDVSVGLKILICLTGSENKAVLDPLDTAVIVSNP